MFEDTEYCFEEQKIKKFVRRKESSSQRARFRGFIERAFAEGFREARSRKKAKEKRLDKL